jgi:hypothetical protein
MKMLMWFIGSNPFDVSDSRLRNIASGVVASEVDGINCDAAEEMGASIMYGRYCRQ